jgi:hypothetical protein
MNASLKTLTNSKDFSESCIKFLYRLSLALIGQFSQCTMYIHGWLLEQLSGSPPEELLDVAIRNPKQTV